MKDETKFLIEIADKFGKEAQNVLDFVAKDCNLGVNDLLRSLRKECGLKRNMTTQPNK